MKRIHTLKPAILLFALFAASVPCRPGQSITAMVPPEIGLEPAEIETSLAREGVRCPDGGSLVLSVYYYSESIEEMSVSDEGMTETVKPGRIKVLLKYRSGSKLKKVFFLEASGNSKQEILDNLAREVRRKLG